MAGAPEASGARCAICDAEGSFKNNPTSPDTGCHPFAGCPPGARGTREPAPHSQWGTQNRARMQGSAKRAIDYLFSCHTAPVAWASPVWSPLDPASQVAVSLWMSSWLPVPAQLGSLTPACWLLVLSSGAGVRDGLGSGSLGPEQCASLKILGCFSVLCEGSKTFAHMASLL